MDTSPVLTMVGRLVSKYRSSFREDDYGGMWKHFFDTYQRPLHELFMRGSDEEALAALSHPASNYLHCGFENTTKGNKGHRHRNAALLRRLSFAVGAERLPNPETPLRLRARIASAVEKRRERPDEVLSRIDQVLGQIPFPNIFPGEDGIITGRGLASVRAINAVYQASILKGRVLEIGGGLGRTAFYAQRFGVTDYTIVDLPMAGISQGYFLGMTLGAHSVKLISPTEFFASTGTYDIVLNADSLTEMSIDMAARYTDAIQQRAGWFISINHEANAFTVRELMRQRSSRHPYWLRDGYVEEHFVIP